MDASVPTIMWPGFESPPSKPINNSKNVLNLKTIDGHKNNKSGWKCSMAEISLHRDGGCLLRTAVSMSRSDNRLLTINNFCRILTFNSLTLGYIQCDQMATSFFNIYKNEKFPNGKKITKACSKFCQILVYKPSNNCQIPFLILPNAIQTLK